MHANRINPLELVASNLSFQNIRNINKTFSTLIGKPFFREAKQIKMRIETKPDFEFEMEQSDIDTLQEIFEERHLLIHNPNMNSRTSLSSAEDRIYSLWVVIMASDAVLNMFINKNIDPKIRPNNSTNTDDD